MYSVKNRRGLVILIGKCSSSNDWRGHFWRNTGIIGACYITNAWIRAVDGDGTLTAKVQYLTRKSESKCKALDAYAPWGKLL
jgi:hypothetical protein